MIVVCSECCVTLGALALTRLVASLEAFEAEHMETFGQHGIFLLHLARRTCQLFLVLTDFFHQYFVGRACHLNFLGSIQLFLQDCQLFL